MAKPCLYRVTFRDNCLSLDDLQVFHVVARNIVAAQDTARQYIVRNDSPDAMAGEYPRYTMTSISLISEEVTVESLLTPGEPDPRD